MRHFDLSPLYKTTIGFDRLADLLDEFGGFDGEGAKYPPYNIELMDENQYRLTMAVAGFDDSEIAIEVKENVLTVKGEKAPDDNEATYLHRGIAARNFERKFQLADHVVVSGAEMAKGLLHVDLAREIPEAMKPRKIAIQTAEKAKTIENKAA